MIWFKYLILLISLYGYQCGPMLPIKPSKGGVIPLPQEIEQTRNFFILRPSLFRFLNGNQSCYILDRAIDRYWKLIYKSFSSTILEKKTEETKELLINDPYYLGVLNEVNIELDGPCNDDDFPHLNMNENYTIVLNQLEKSIKSSSVWGLLRGLETFSQLIYKADDTYTLLINVTNIQDYPRFSHRGLLLDTARHFIPLKSILKTLDAMSFNKMNVFHWHIVDDQSFPYKSKTFPELSNKGAYHSMTAVYEPQDVKYVIEYARLRGIRVMIEFDTPGHTLAWGKGVKDILTKCVGISDEFGPMDPSKSSLYDFLDKFFSEISETFPDRYIHLGGDEVDFDCWKSNPNITNFMKQLNIQSYSKLENYYIQKLLKIVNNKGLQSIVWEEVFDNGVDIPDSTIVHVWKGGYQDTMAQVTKAGNLALLSSCWYLDHLGGLADWIDYYKCDPYDFNGNVEQKNLVLGGEACMWSEAVNQYNVISRVWPRASAVAEKLWSSVTTMDLPYVLDSQIYDMQNRMEEHTCRMNSRGIEAQPPSGPSYCY